MASHWYNPLSWRMFGYEDPKTGDYVEMDMTVGGKATKAGVRITPTKAMNISIVWACVKILSETVSGLPLKLYDDKDGKRQLVAHKDRASRIMRKPNPFMTRLNFLNAVVVNMALRGNAFAIIERSSGGDPIGFTLVSPDDVTVDTLDSRLIYYVSLDGIRPVG